MAKVKAKVKAKPKRKVLKVKRISPDILKKVPKLPAPLHRLVKAIAKKDVAAVVFEDALSEDALSDYNFGNRPKQ